MPQPCGRGLTDNACQETDLDSFSERLSALSSAEDFFAFFGLPVDARLLQVHRLRILARFHRYLNECDGLTGLDDIEMFRRYRTLLARAYRDFVAPMPAREKILKLCTATTTAAGGPQPPARPLLLRPLREPPAACRPQARAA